jgi:hypothetical protein
MTGCAECGQDVMYLDDLGVGPNVCGYCRAFLCPTCDGHGKCAPKIETHNREIDKRELDEEIARLQQKRAALDETEERDK